MKLKEGFVTHNIGEEYVAVATGEAGKNFSGMIRNNKTADFIFKSLMTDTTEENIIDAMLEKYNAPREVITADVHRVIETLRDAGVLDE